jgi:hypothetical protein
MIVCIFFVSLDAEKRQAASILTVKHLVVEPVVHKQRMNTKM